MKKDEGEEEEKEGKDEEEDEEKRVSEVHVRRGRRQSGKQGDVRKALAIVLHFTTKSLFRYGRCSIQVGKSPLLFLPRAPLSLRTCNATLPPHQSSSISLNSTMPSPAASCMSSTAALK